MFALKSGPECDIIPLGLSAKIAQVTRNIKAKIIWTNPKTIVACLLVKEQQIFESSDMFIACKNTKKKRKFLCFLVICVSS